MSAVIGKTLIKWYKNHKRELPWRDTKDPYKIWLSEIILQQTQVAQGMSYYLKFTQHYPTVKQLANAKEDEVLKLWQGLGYYSRARNLHATAKIISNTHKNKFPQTYDSIIQLKGIGAYTAAAISSFAYNLPHAVVDGNVYRVLSRLFNINLPINSTEGKKLFQQLADELIDQKDPGTYNQAIMEFGSQYCKPANPKCEACVLQNQCLAFAKKTVANLPVKINKTKIKNRYLNYFLISDKKNNVYVQQRGKKDIWEGLYELFLIETAEETPLTALLKNKELNKLTGSKFTVSSGPTAFKHILSHQHLYAQFYVIKLNTVFNKKVISISSTKLHQLAWPRLIDKFLNICALD